MVRQRKKLQDLTIKDNFMFAAVMLEPENAKKFLELALGIQIDYVKVEKEKSIVYNPEYKGVRLDVFVKDGKGTHFNVEMQAALQVLQKRVRYYHDQIDMDLLASGAEYEELPDSYVIFICDFDPLGLKKYQYTVRQTLEEDSEYTYSDGRHTVFLSTVGTNSDQVPEALVKFLKFVAADLMNSEEDYEDDFVRQLQNSIRKIKTSRDMEGRFMLFEEMMKNEYKAGHEDGKAEGIIEGRKEGIIEGRNEGIIEGRNEGKREGKMESVLQLLTAKYTISDTIQEKIKSVNDESVLSDLLIKVATSNSVEEFEAELDKSILVTSD